MPCKCGADHIAEFRSLSSNFTSSCNGKVSLESPDYQKLIWDLTGFIRDECCKKRHDEEGLVYNNEDPAVDDYNSKVWSNQDWSKNPELWDETNYEVLKGLGDSFLGESGLTAIERGSAYITRGKDLVMHYCSGYRDKPAYIAQSVWWTNPNNWKDKRWFCQRCFKKAFRDNIDFPSKWELGDLLSIRDLGKTRTRYPRKADHKIEIHYGEQEGFRLDKIISRYIREREEHFEFEKPEESLFHYERVKEDRYLKTAIATAIAAMEIESYDLPRKGGRRPSCGPNSIAKYCELNYTKEIGSVKPIRIKFNVNRIRDIMRKESKLISIKHPIF